MNFIHQAYQPGETVAAIATPLGEGGVAIIRISGDSALAVAAKVFSGDVCSYQTHTAHFGFVKDALGNHVDDALALVMLGKRSYTGEDTVEIHCHGGSLISRRVLDVILAAGARAAFPGEFTFKAYINGKLDLTQAEAVQELIAAKNERALDAAEQHLRGALSKRIRSFQHALTDTAAILEAWVDFPEEGLEFASMEEICEGLEAAIHNMQQLLDTFHDGKILHDGLSLCLVGSPNVGKSSLMNALLDKERAIVSPIPGTTRDIVEDHLRLNGLNIKLTDTAGIRESDEVIEQEGIRRSKQALKEADLVLLVLDISVPLGPQELQLIELVPPHKAIAVWNKSDLAHDSLPPLSLPNVVKVSAKERVGLDQLRQLVDKVIWEHGPPSREEVLITNVRHKEALSNAISACKAVITGLKTDISPEFIASDMRYCLTELGRIIGTNVTEDILSAIFSKFCVGK
ncbi:MAG: tRNA uridine-5-carboxymethylaminomethyl(34) synthesis GTPase MnmE [Chlamydiales bacterium]|nr:tRNA uridine-5-carboxymethylaminomethyl(34) synthesis GTPase MnmE [Chlamydiales bacterium]